MSTNINTNINDTMFPGFGRDNYVQEIRTRLCRESGGRFVEILNASPYEIAVVFRLTAYLNDRKEV